MDSNNFILDKHFFAEALHDAIDSLLDRIYAEYLDFMSEIKHPDDVDFYGYADGVEQYLIYILDTANVVPPRRP